MRKSPAMLPDSIHLIWHINDIKNIDNTLTDDQCREILDQLKRTHDASIGINWEVIDCAIDYYRLENNMGLRTDD